MPDRPDGLLGGARYISTAYEASYDSRAVMGAAATTCNSQLLQNLASNRRGNKLRVQIRSTFVSCELMRQESDSDAPGVSSYRGQTITFSTTK